MKRTKNEVVSWFSLSTSVKELYRASETQAGWCSASRSLSDCVEETYREGIRWSTVRLVLNCVFPCWASAVSLLLEIMPVWVLSYVFSFCQLAVFAAIISQFISTVISQPNYPTKITEEMYPLCVLLLSSGGWCLYLQPASAKTGRGDPNAPERECRPLGRQQGVGGVWSQCLLQNLF